MLVRRAIVGSALLLGAVAVVGLAPQARSGQAADSYAVDSVHSAAIFRVKHMNASYSYGRFNEIKGGITFDEASPASSSVEIEIKADSIDTGNDKRDGHLKSPDFFNAAKFPTLGFKSKSFAKAGENTFDVTGDLTIHGVTKPVTVKLEKAGSMKGPRGEVIGFETTFTIKRSDHDMKFMLDGVGDDVRITVSLEAGKK